MAQYALRAFLAPGNAFCELLHMNEEDDRMMVRTLINMLFWNLILVIAAYFIFRG